MLHSTAIMNAFFWWLVYASFWLNMKACHIFQEHFIYNKCLMFISYLNKVLKIEQFMPYRFFV